jgi:hypothetical protein
MLVSLFHAPGFLICFLVQAFFSKFNPAGLAARPYIPVGLAAKRPSTPIRSNSSFASFSAFSL